MILIGRIIYNGKSPTSYMKTLENIPLNLIDVLIVKTYSDKLGYILYRRLVWIPGCQEKKWYTYKIRNPSSLEDEAHFQALIGSYEKHGDNPNCYWIDTYGSGMDEKFGEMKDIEEYMSTRGYTGVYSKSGYIEDEDELPNTQYPPATIEEIVPWVIKMNFKGITTTQIRSLDFVNKSDQDIVHLFNQFFFHPLEFDQNWVKPENNVF